MIDIDSLLNGLQEKPESKTKIINDWVQPFLRGEGNNLPLADTLLQYDRFVTLVPEYPLSEVITILGPTSEYKFYEEKSELDKRVDRMIDSLEKDWKPAPLILTDIWEDYLELADGGHRHRALVEAGYATYPAIIYFRDSKSKEKFKKQLYCI